MLNTIRTDAIQHGADYFLPPQQCLQQAREALIYSRGCTWLILFPGVAPLAGNGHSLAKSGNNVRKQKQSSPEGVRQQGLRALRVAEIKLHQQLLQTRFYQPPLGVECSVRINQRFPSSALAGCSGMPALDRSIFISA